MKRILVVGDLGAEIVLGGLSAHPRRGREVFVSDARIRAGGAGARFAGALDRLGRGVTLVARVGGDELGDLVVAGLKGKVQGAARARDRARRTGLSIAFSDDPDASLVTYPGATTALSPRDLAGIDWRRYRHVHIASPFQLLGLPLAPLLRKAKSAGLTVSLSAGSDPRGRWDLRALFPALGVLILGELEAKALGGSARKLAAEVALVVVRRGGKGALALTAAGEWKASGPASGPVFDAAFIDGWLDGHRVPEILAYAVAASSLAAERGDEIGDTPTRSEALRQVARIQ
jgi:ribokinase